MSQTDSPSLNRRDPNSLAAYLAVARGEEPADLLLTGGRVVDVYGHRIFEAEVALWGGRVVGFGSRKARESLDISGGYLAPSFIDGHMHLESSQLTPPAYTAAAVPRGTGAVAADPHEIANVLGLEGVEWLIEAGRGLDMDFLFNAPSCVPASPLGTAGANLEARDLVRLTDQPEVMGLGEVMNFPGVVGGDPGMLAKLAAFEGRPIDGHAPLLSGPDLDAYALAGPASDHECMNLEEAADKLSRGLRIMIREGSTVKNMADLLPLVTPANSRRMMLVTDDLHAGDLLTKGHLDHLLRRAVRLGLDPITAVQMVSLNTAEHFRLAERGAVAPGRLADLVVLNDLQDFRARLVLHQGRIAAREGEALRPFEPVSSRPPEAMNVAPYSAAELAVPAGAGRMRIIGLVPDQVFTEQRLIEPISQNGLAVADSKQDLAKLAVIERHRASGNIGLGFVQGFGLQKGALASSVGHDCHNIIGTGLDDEDLYLALKRVEEMGGGQCAAAGGQVLAEHPLPIAGLMSPLSATEVESSQQGLQKAAADLGCAFDPFMALSFLALEVIPELKLTDKGLVDVTKFELVDLFKE